MGQSGAWTVYAAEDQWASVLDRGGSVDFFGSSIVVPKQRRFTTLDQMQEYANAVIVSAADWINAGPVTVRARKGQTRAHYEVGSAVIAVPMGSDWALRESVLLHELAHHLAAAHWGDGNGSRHGPEFTGCLCALVELRHGPESALVLRSAYAAAGVAVTPMSAAAGRMMQ